MAEENKPQILVTKIEILDRYIAVINRIRMYQEPEESACAALGVDAQTYRKVMALLPDKIERIPYTMWADWEDRLLSNICMEPRQAPPDFFSILMKIRDKEECEHGYSILIEYYRNNMTCLEIGEQYDVSPSSVRRQLDQMLRLLRKPKYRAALQYGAEYTGLQEYLTSGQTEYETNIAEVLKEQTAFRENKLLEMEDEFSRQEKEEEVRRIGQEASDRNDKLRKTDIEELGFSVRTENAMKRSGIRTAYHISILTPEQLLGIRNLGPVSRQEVREKMMEKYGIKMPNV